MRQRFLSISLLVLSSLILLGCGPISNLNIDRDGATVEVALKEQQVNRILKRSDLTISDDDSSILDSITDVNFQEGHIEVEGTYTDNNGDTQVGSFEIEMGATDGMLNVQIVNVDIVNVDPAKIEEANRELAAEFAKEAESGDVEFRNVTVTESELTMQVNINF